MKDLFNVNKSAKRNQRGLTLFELLVVLTIMALVATLVAPRVAGYLGRAKTDTARAQAANISSALELFYLDFDRYPNLEEGLIALINAPSETTGWRGPYMKDADGLVDPWGRAYVYGVSDDGEAFTVSSLGEDGENGGEGDDEDIIAR